MQLITSQNHTLVKTGIENYEEPGWFDLKGDIVNPGIRYSESERQCPSGKGRALKKKDMTDHCIHTKKIIIVKQNFSKQNKVYNGN